jgi:hypothetical protein
VYRHELGPIGLGRFALRDSPLNVHPDLFKTQGAHISPGYPVQQFLINPEADLQPVRDSVVVVARLRFAWIMVVQSRRSLLHALRISLQRVGVADNRCIAND